MNSKCYNCGEYQSDFYDNENGYTYVKCNGCGLVYLNPMPSNESIQHSHQIGLHKGENDVDVTGKYQPKKIKKYQKVLNDFFSTDSFKNNELKWLDIGCGHGEFIESLNIHNRKLVIKGSEPNKKKIASCHKRNMDVEFIDLKKHNVRYNYISLLNVFSHLPDPIEFITEIKSNLAPHGEIFLQTGHSCHLSPKDHHKPYYAPDHISFANQSIVEGILEKCSFKIIQTKLYRHEQFPTLSNPMGIIIETAKIILNKNGSIYNFFPKHPNRDMYVRAMLI